jgi:hypothetical protein
MFPYLSLEEVLEHGWRFDYEHNQGSFSDCDPSHHHAGFGGAEHCLSDQWRANAGSHFLSWIAGSDCASNSGCSSGERRKVRGHVQSKPLLSAELEDPPSLV